MAVARLPFSFASRYKLALEMVADKPVLYFVAPLPLEAVREAKRVLKVDFAIQQLDGEAFDSKLTQLYQRDSSETRQLMEDLGSDDDFFSLAEELPNNQDLLDSDDDAPIIKLINAMLSEAIKEGASDIHIETFETVLSIRFRVDGVLREVLTPSRKLAPLLVSRVKVMAKLDIAEKRIPQDGRISLRIGGRAVDVRVSTMPSSHGERVVMRILDKNATRLDLHSLGMTADNHHAFRELIQRPHGILLVTGPTGSGKSTTLYAGLQELDRHEKNILTVEDPIEFDIDGIGQTQVNPKVDMTFARGLRAILRQDPDVISVGEIRDGETGAIAIRAAITGHLVLSTLHTNDAVSAIDRLVDIGVEPYLISSALRGVISQRLVRKVCPHCKKAYRPEAEELAMLGLPENANVQFYRGEGCQECYHTGYKGRRAVFEIFMLNGRIRRMVTEGAKYDALSKAAAETGFVTMRENCRNLVLRGEISAAEAARAINSTAD